MEDDDLNESRPFPGPMVRVRARVSRRGDVTWALALRTFKGRGDAEGEHGISSTPPEAMAVVDREPYIVEILDYEGSALVSRPVRLDFFAQDQEAATFSIRMPYDRNGEQLQLRRGERVLSRIQVPTERPYFTLLHPNDDDYIDPDGVLHLHWAAHTSEYPLAYFVRYTPDGGKTWHRPGVNLKTNDYYVDLREMPGGQRCRVEVLATNGYRTSYVRTRWFSVPRKPPMVFLGDTGGPTLFGQGFSLEDGPLPVEWRADDGSVIATGATCDVRLPVVGTRKISAAAADVTGLECTVLVGRYDNIAGNLVLPEPGL